MPKILIELEAFDKILEAIEGIEKTRCDDTYYQRLQRNDKNQVILHSWAFLKRIDVPADEVIAQFEVIDDHITPKTPIPHPPPMPFRIDPIKRSPSASSHNPNIKDRCFGNYPDIDDDD